MKEIMINLNTVDKVKDFVTETLKFNGEAEMDLVSGRYLINATSILGIFSLDLTKPVLLKIHTEDEQVASKIYQALARFEAE